MSQFAVLIPLVEHEGEDQVLLTQRNADLPQYSGQVSFPCGAYEPEDEDLRATALRECFEEVGIRPEQVEIIAQFQWFETGLGHRVLPFAGRVRSPYDLRPSPAEVERIIFVPVALLQRDPFEIRGTFEDSSGNERTIYTFLFDDAEIWGLTARILRHVFVEGSFPFA